MVRTVGSSGPRTLEAIREAGLKLIYQFGYDAMSLRQLAAVVGIQQGSLYNHISTKQELLFDLIRVHMEDLIGDLDLALDGVAGAAPRLRAFVDFHINYHFTRKREVFISYSELRSLDADNYAAIVALRRAYEHRLIAILDEGSRDGAFVALDTKVTAYGILAMLAGICTWFKPGGRLSEDEVKAAYMNMVFGAVMMEGSASLSYPKPLVLAR